jgi:hypothetical protein
MYSPSAVAKGMVRQGDAEGTGAAMADQRYLVVDVGARRPGSQAAMTRRCFIFNDHACCRNLKKSGHGS